MYDTLNLRLEADKAPLIDLMAELPLKLNQSSIKEIHNTYGPPSVTGSYKGFYMKINESGIYMSGSLNKYFHGTNVINLTYQDSVKAIDRLSEELGLPLRLASVYRIDFSANYSMNYPAKAYYEYLGAAPRYSKLIAPTGITYSNTRRALVFYDKIAECNKKKVLIPFDYKDLNLLRYESRFLNRLPQIFNQPITVEELLNRDFYIELLNRYKSSYDSIHKHNKIVLKGKNNKGIITVKNFEDEMMLHGAKVFGGETGLLDMIDDSRHLGIFKNAMQVKRFKDRIKRICSRSLITEPSELILELSEKIDKQIQSELGSL